MGADEGILIPYPNKYDYHIVTNLLSEAIKKIKDYSKNKRLMNLDYLV